MEGDEERLAIGPARGVTVAELQDIGHEVGISRELIARAAAELERGGRSPSRGLLSAPTTRRDTRVVPARLDRDQLAELVRIVDDTMTAQGTVTEALGGVRWTSSSRRLSRQVQFEPKEGETVIRVEERYPTHVFRLARWLPTAYVGFFSWLIATEGATEALAGGTVLAVSLAVTVWLVASFILRWVAGESRDRVHGLADRLAERAEALGRGDGPAGLSAAPAADVGGGTGRPALDEVATGLDEP
jgi:hypothetical protein